MLQKVPSLLGLFAPFFQMVDSFTLGGQMKRLVFACLLIITTLGFASPALAMNLSMPRADPPGGIMEGDSVNFSCDLSYFSPGNFTVNTVELYVDGVQVASAPVGVVLNTNDSVSSPILNYTFANAGAYRIEIFVNGAGYVSPVMIVSVAAPVPPTPPTPPGMPVATSRTDPTKDAEVIGANNAQMANVERFMRLHTGNISSRLAQVRGQSGLVRRSHDFSFLPGNSSSQAGPGQFGEDPGTLVAVLAMNAPLQESLDMVKEELEPRTWSLWVKGGLNTGYNRKSGSDNDHTTFGATFGLDNFFTPNFAAGIALGYAHDKTDVGSRGSESKADAYSLALYGTWLFEQGFFIDFGAGYTRIDFDSKRYTPSGLADGERNGDQFFAVLGGGYEFRFENFMISPYAHMDAATTRLDKYTESGAGRNSLRYDSANVNLFSLSAGLRGEYAHNMPWGTLTPFASLEYTHNFKDSLDQKLGYADTGLYDYTLRNEALAKSQTSAGIGLNAAWHNGLSLSGEYLGTYAKSYVDHGFFLRLAWEW